MEFEVSYSLDNEQQFWDGRSLLFVLKALSRLTSLSAELDDIVSVHCQTHELIDNALRLYLHFTTIYKDEYLRSEYDVARCSCRLLDSTLFLAHKDYVRRQIIYGLLQEDAPNTLLLIASFLLFDGRQNENTFEMMNDEGAFPRLLELIQSTKDNTELHQMLLELLYEMSRIQRLNADDLRLIDDSFVIYLFQIIEQLSDDVDDPYHYPVIRVLLVLNEQYMVSAHDPGPGNAPESLTNRVIKMLSLHGSAYKTFGENIILLLNRESETSLQLLILKLLYLLFTTRSTYEYFYTNDLHVLVDVMIRNLLDLPEESAALRHTYLRVLYPLLAHTQLKNPPHYKREEIMKVLYMMTNVRSAHFAPMDETTIRLVGRCAKVPWLRDEGADAAGVAKRLLGMQLEEARGSSLSVVEVAAQKEKPGVMTPSRGDATLHRQDDEAPPVPAIAVDGTDENDKPINNEIARNSPLEKTAAIMPELRSPFEVDGEV
ncbi:MAG: hypothetical protein M1819_003097 [Sarea resinae]|nr:MAG: hypothetical protein M1819_003097 [Sarea resinae]